MSDVSPFWNLLCRRLRHESIHHPLMTTEPFAFPQAEVNTRAVIPLSRQKRTPPLWILLSPPSDQHDGPTRSCFPPLPWPNVRVFIYSWTSGKFQSFDFVNGPQVDHPILTGLRLLFFFSLPRHKGLAQTRRNLTQP